MFLDKIQTFSVLGFSCFTYIREKYSSFQLTFETIGTIRHNKKQWDRTLNYICKISKFKIKFSSFKCSSLAFHIRMPTTVFHAKSSLVT